MRYLKALTAALVLAGLLVGVPLGLILGYGNPVHGLTQGLVTDTTILDVLAVLTWGIWLQMTICLLLETVNQVRTLRGSGSLIALPAFGPQADIARILIGAVLAVGVVGASAGIGASKASATPAAAPVVAAQAVDAAARHDSEATVPTREVVVQPGDTLWKLAEIHLGDGTQWRTIADLNHGRQLGGGVVATTAILKNGLQPGWHLLIPATPMAADHHVVEAGENLSEIAQETTGSATNWPNLYASNRAVIGNDPNLIHPGEDLTISPRGHAEADPATPADSPTVPAAPSSHLEAFEARHDSQEAVGLATTTSTEQAAPERAPSASEMQTVAPWLVGSLLFTGGILAGHLHLRLRERRRDRFRQRRPGRAISVPSLELASVEKTITNIGGPHAAAIEFLDLELRRLGQTQTAQGSRLPALAAIELTDHAVIAHLAEPASLPSPWVAGASDELRWITHIATDSPHIDIWDCPAPYPLLATIGHDDRGHWWLLNLEQLGVVTISGDPDRERDLMRHVAAELAVAAWARDARIDLIGIGAELEGLDPKLRLHNSLEDAAATSDVMSYARTMIDRARDADTTTPTARVNPPDDEVWGAQLLVSAASDQDTVRDHLAPIIELIHVNPDCTATAVLQTAAAGESGIVLDVSSDATVRIEAAGLTLTASQLPATDAAGITNLYQQAASLTDTDVPVQEEATDGWQSHIDAAGNLREEHTIDRSTRTVGIDTTTLLPGRDGDYLDHAATVDDDLHALAPQVSARVATAIRDADPHLETDLTDWIQHSSRRPRLRLLGQVKAVGYGEHLDEIGQRAPFYAELVAFLWTHSKQGATLAEIMSAFPTMSEGRVRRDLATVRGWLGINALTGEPLLPAATQAPARAHHHKNVYQLDCGPGGLIVDVDLLRRLRADAQAIGGAAGIARITTALIELVDGQPFSGLRAGGWSWMLDEDRIDEHMVVAISDMAHLAITHYLAVGDVANARVAADIGLLAAPYEETMRLDLVAVKEAEGNHKEAAALLNTAVLNRSDDGLPPLDLSERTRRILKNRGWDQAG